MRVSTVVAVVACVLIASRAYAQAPATGPLLLRLPATPRAAALGNAWVAGRDHDVVFYNPAQLVGARGEFDVSVARIGPGTTMATLGSAFAAGKWSLTLGWGAQLLRYSVDPAAPYPYAPDVLLSKGSADAFSSLFAVGGAIAYKGFRMGATCKYAFDSVPAASGAAGAESPPHGALLADVGVARNLWRGVIAGSVQNLGGTPEDKAPLAVPRQVLIGWSTARQAGPLDLGIYTQVAMRDGWASPGAGLEVGYSWIEGYNIALRVGARRPETTAEHPMAFGAAFTVDRFTIEYAIQIFDGGRTANGVTVRWR
jgi:hypothetical protein